LDGRSLINLREDVAGSVRSLGASTSAGAESGFAEVPELGVTRGIYADANATAPPIPAVVEAVANAMRTTCGNAASAHAAGAAARRAVEEARVRVASLLDGCFEEDITFTSGGTESNNAVLKHFDDAGAVFLTARIEHASVLRPLARADTEGRVVWLDVDGEGRIDPEGARRAARSAPRADRYVLAIQAANGETGVVQPVDAVVAEIRYALDPVYVLLDAAQAVGRRRLSLSDLDADAVTFSAHKLHGPQGVGALVLANSDVSVRPMILGGGQERGLRSGTLNVPGIVGFGVAARTRRENFPSDLAAMGRVRDAFEGRLKDRLGGRVTFNGAGAERLANTSNARFAGVDGMRMLAHLDLRGVMASLGSACSSGKPEPSTTLLAMGLSPTEAFGSVRFSFSILNGVEEVIMAADVAADIVGGFPF